MPASDGPQFNARIAERTARRQIQLSSSDMATLQSQISGLKTQLASAQQQLKSAQDLIAILDANDTATTQSLNTISTTTGSLAGRVSAVEANKLNRILLPDWTVEIAKTTQAALLAGNRTYTLNLAATLGVKAGDPIFVSPKAAVPAGYLVGAASAPVANQLQVQISNPLIAVGGSMSIVLSVYTLRP